MQAAGLIDLWAEGYVEPVEPPPLAFVEATDDTGRSRWKGGGRGLEFRLSHAIKRILAVDDDSEHWSRRAKDRLGEIRNDFSWLEADSSSAVLTGGGEAKWWTFGGNRANATLANQLAQEMRCNVSHDSFTLTFESAVKLQDVERAIESIRQNEVTEMRPIVDEAAVDGLKFSECLPMEFATEMLERRLQDVDATRQILGRPVRFVVHQ